MSVRRLPGAYPTENGKAAHVANGKARSAPNGTTVARKAEHIRINVEEDVAAKGVASGFNDFQFVHHALPDIDYADVNPSTEMFGRRLGAPILISCMTGGTEEAEQLNLALARVAQAFSLPMGLGSGRVLLEHPEALPSFGVRRVAPDVLLFANIGAVQLNRGVSVDDCRRIVDRIGADALVLHLNPLQEALQPEGDTCFRGLLDRIAALCQGLDVPVVVKEVGWGIAPDVVRMLVEAGVAAVDVAGAGGTSWSEVERHRMPADWRAHVAAAFAGWGMPTADALRAAHRVIGPARLIASGGIHDGIDVAKALALGADLVGLAGPFLRSAARGEAAELAQELIETLRIAMFCVGAATVDDLRQTNRLVQRSQGRRAYREPISYATSGGNQFIDITEDVAAVIARSGVQNGLVHVYSHHTTAAIRINENEPLLLGDFRRLLDRLIPVGGYDHDDLDRRVGVPPNEPKNGHAHSRHLLLASSETIPVTDGRMELGRWQRLFLIELCSARPRDLTVQVIGE
ncbi:MAG: type 2 isopentenyl-diphosphate Delta-isomerase [Chloroflexi bacterium]|nr:type 2 isopentenyl-diphosphate Delta-isomerase [Chloroflexota bacterium]